MFFLEDLPSREVLQGFASRFPEMEVDATEACLKLLWLASHLLRDLEAHFATHGLSQARFLVLIILERTTDKHLMPVQVAKQLGISKKNTTRLLSFMEADQLINRVSHESDGRASLISISAKGSKVLAEAMPGYYRVLNKVMRPLDGDAKASLIVLLSQLGHSYNVNAERGRRQP